MKIFKILHSRSTTQRRRPLTKEGLLRRREKGQTDAPNPMSPFEIHNTSTRSTHGFTTPPPNNNGDRDRRTMMHHHYESYGETTESISYFLDQTRTTEDTVAETPHHHGSIPSLVETTPSSLHTQGPSSYAEDNIEEAPPSLVQTNTNTPNLSRSPIAEGRFAPACQQLKHGMQVAGIKIDAAAGKVLKPIAKPADSLANILDIWKIFLFAFMYSQGAPSMLGIWNTFVAFALLASFLGLFAVAAPVLAEYMEFVTSQLEIFGLVEKKAKVEKRPGGEC